jgi:hypothetical protein
VPEVTVSLSTRDGLREIKIEMDDDSYKLVEEIARTRNKTVGEIVLEALRVEKLFADGKLLVRAGRDIRDLVAV